MTDLPPADDVGRYKRELVEELAPGVTGRWAYGTPPAAAAAPLATRLPSGGIVVGVGLGAKQTAGGISGELAVRVYVRTKLTRRQLAAEGVVPVPAEVNGLPTDVVAVGDVTARRPVLCGGSVGHVDVGAGTLGCLVDTGEDVPAILSNNHVLADVNAGEVGDVIVEPGPADGGTDPIALLADYETIAFEGVANAMDAAVARLIDPGDVLPEIMVIGAVRNPAVPARLYQSVRKHGRTTRHTVGVVMDVSADLWVDMGGQRRAWFEDQLDVVGAGGDFSQPGDSGSLVVDAVERSPVGLLFAGGSGHTFVNPVAPVLERFGATVL